MNKDLKCWEIKECPPCQYLMCPAYALDKNCWEVPGTKCRKIHSQYDCKNCDVYLLHNTEICRTNDILDQGNLLDLIVRSLR